MPKITRSRAPAEDPEYTYQSFIRGLNTFQPANKLRADELSEAQNVEIFQDSVDKRFGTSYVGNSKDSRTRGLAIYTHSDGTKKIIRSSGTTLQAYNTSTQDYDNLAGKTYTNNLNTDYILAYDDLYVFNGTDNLTKYNKDDSPVITTYTQVSAPTNGAAARGSGLSAGDFIAYYVLTHYNEIGETTGTSEFSATFNKARNLWNGTTESATITWTNSAGADGTNIYYAPTSGDWTFLDTVSSASATTYIDQGGELEPDGITEPPETNSTGGVVAYAGCFDGTRLIAFKGSTVFYSGGGAADIDHFDSGSGGGAVNVAKGDGDTIQHCRRARDGSIIIYKKFSIWKLEFLSGVVPISLSLVNSLYGCVGRRAATSVDDDHIFMSPYGIYTLGNQPNFPTDILRIQSISRPIDKELEKITPSNLPNVVLHYDFKRRLRLAYTEAGGTANDSELLFKDGAWVRNTGISANCYVNMVDNESGSAIIDELSKRYTLYGSDDAGRVVQIDKGYSDRGSAIDAYFVTKADDQNLPFRQKKYYDQDILLNRLQGTMTVTQMFDEGDDIQVTITNVATAGVGGEVVGLSPVGEEYGTSSLSNDVFIHRRWKLFGRQKKYIQTKVRENSTNGIFSVMSLGGVYRPKSRRQIDSDNLLTTTTI